MVSTGTTGNRRWGRVENDPRSRAYRRALRWAKGLTDKELVDFVQRRPDKAGHVAALLLGAKPAPSVENPSFDLRFDSAVVEMKARLHGPKK